MQKSEVILAAMASAHRAAAFDALRIQKLIFLIEQEAASYIEGPHFDFEPYHYGPFDKMIFRGLDKLWKSGEVEFVQGERTHYALTELGYRSGREILGDLPEPVSEYFERCARWILSHSFGAILSAIYDKYPDMAVNSVVPEMKTRYALGILRSPVPPLVLGTARTFDLGGVLDEDDWDIDPEQDTRMLERDWIAVGDDLRNAMADF